MSNSCFVIIVTYNGEVWLRNCLDSVIESSVPTEILVVDNGSTDGTISILKEYQAHITQLPNSENLGFGAANNMALKVAYDRKASFFFLLNQDAYVEGSTIERLCDFLNANRQYGLASPVQLNGSGTSLDTAFAGYMRKEFSGSFLDDYRNLTCSTAYNVPFVNAASWMITRECMEQVGIFHPLFFHYGEDNNYAARVLKADLQIAVVAGVSVRHDREQRAFNPYKDDPKAIFNWKTMVNELDSSKVWLHRQILILIDLVTITRSCIAGQKWTFFRYGLKEWGRIKRRVRSFDEADLNITQFDPYG